MAQDPVTRQDEMRDWLLAGRAADADAIREARVHADVPEGIGAVGILRAELSAGEPAVVDAHLVRAGAAEPRTLANARPTACKRAILPANARARALRIGRARRADAVARVGAVVAARVAARAVGIPCRVEGGQRSPGPRNARAPSSPTGGSAPTAWRSRVGRRAARRAQDEQRARKPESRPRCRSATSSRRLARCDPGRQSKRRWDTRECGTFQSPFPPIPIFNGP